MGRHQSSNGRGPRRGGGRDFENLGRQESAKTRGRGDETVKTANRGSGSRGGYTFTLGQCEGVEAQLL